MNDRSENCSRSEKPDPHERSSARMPLRPAFDAYHKWLGIPPKDQPPNHYRLLGLELFESDMEVIEAAANRQMAYVQQRATGENVAISQKLLNELSAARVCLLDSKRKAAYDVQLRSQAGSPPVASSSPTIPRPVSPQPVNARPVGARPVSPQPANPRPAHMPQSVERPAVNRRDAVFAQAQQAYDVHDYERVVKLLESLPVDDSVPEIQNLLESARFTLDQIQTLSRELVVAWKQKNVKQVTQVAKELISIQPLHGAANEAMQWAKIAYLQFHDVRHRGWS